MAHGVVRFVAVVSLCATVAMLGGFSSTKRVHNGHAFRASLGGTLYNCTSYSKNPSGSVLMYNCTGTNGSQGSPTCMRDSWAAGTWSRYFRTGNCATSHAQWIFAKSWRGIV